MILAGDVRDAEGMREIPYRYGECNFMLIGDDGTFCVARYLDEKQRLLDVAKRGEGTLLVTWHGRRRTDVFRADLAIAEEAIADREKTAVTE